MAKRLLLFFVLCIVSVSFVQAQCNKEYTLSINQTPILTSEYNGNSYTRVNICKSLKANFQVDYLESDSLKFQWFRNDTLVAQTPSLETAISGRYAVEIQGKNCLYKIGRIEIIFTESIDLRISKEELTICENVSSPFDVTVSTDLFLPQVTYQWQKNGKDIPNQNEYFFYPSSSGIYTVRGSSGACSTTSSPINVKASKENIVNSYLRFENGIDVKSDTILLCKDNTYSFTTAYQADWYLNGQYVENIYSFTPTKSGIYYASTEYTDNCIIKTKPVYISLDTKISPLDFNSMRQYNSCTQRDIYLTDPNLKGNNKLQFYDLNTNVLKYNISNVKNFYHQRIDYGDYRVEYQTESCKSDPVRLDLTKNRISLLYNEKKIGGKKITLCNNSHIEIYTNHLYVSELKLYKDGVLVQTKNTAYVYSGFQISEAGKYHLTITDPFCLSGEPVFSDTVEIIAPKAISTKLSINSASCDSSILTATQYEGISYYWYKDNAIIPDQTTATLKLTKNDNGTYYAVLQKDLCSVATESIVYGNQILGETTTLCEGSKLSLESKLKNADISWKGPNGFTSSMPVISIDSIKSQQEGWYVLSTKIDNCSFKDSVQVLVIKKPAFSFEFASRFCLNQNLIVKFRGIPGNYYLNYSLLGGNSFGSSVNLSGNGIQEKYVNLGKIEMKGNKEFFTFQYYNNNTFCMFPMDIPPHGSTLEICTDNFEFTNLKDSYCYQEKIKLKFKLPADLPKNKKFKIRLENYWSKYELGIFSGDSAQITLPDVNGIGLYFIIENEDGSFVALSKNFNINGRARYVYALVGNRYYSSEASHCEGYATKLTSNSVGNVSVQWKKDGMNVPGATQPDFEAKESGIYFFEVNDNGCVVASDSIRIKTGTIPKPSVSSASGITSACVGFGVPLKEDNSFTYTSYEWVKNNKVYDKKPANEIFTAKESGYYKLVASQGSCKAVSDSILIQIGQDLPNTIWAYSENSSSNNKVFVCEGLEVRFYSNDYSWQIMNNGLEASSNFNLQWKQNGKDIKGANNYSYSSTEPGIYYLQIKQGDCVVNSNKVEVVKQNTMRIELLNYSEYEIINPKETITLCQKSSVEMGHYQRSEEMYSWEKELYKDGKLIEKRSFVNDGNGSQSFTIKESGAYSLKLYPADQKGCIAFSDTARFRFVEKSFVLPVDTVFTCTDSMNLYTNYRPDFIKTYQWTYKDKVIGTNNYSIKVPTEEGLYIVESRYTETCSTFQPIFLGRKLNPVISFPGNELNNSEISTCKGKSIDLYLSEVSNLQFGNDPKFTVEWYNGQQKISNNKELLAIEQSGNYFVKTKYKDCKATSNAIRVDVKELRNRVYPAIDSLAICINGGFQLLNANKENGYTYEWFKDDINLENSASTLKATQPGSYKALIQSGDCAAFTPKVKIYPSTQLPTATIAGDTTVNFGDIVNLRLAFASSPPFTYKLNNNQEGTSETSERIHPVKIEENYIYKLISVKNACGEGTVSGEAKVNVIILGNEPLIGHKITIAPVPAESYCEIIFDLPVSQEVSYQLLDMKGQTLSEKNLGQVTYKKQYLNLNHLAAGEYLIRMQIGRDFVTRKLIKF
ncbi:T9SS type A sorting domain-containing protein [Emticicia sp. BO119]|uniref:T9SS type A sorting domain-containing protein n=1 Tax=Emticicia sp. BO119 TaxID=2757768 RepID=UPI0015F03736|nr:T9SS type A sorting domain-containing protein [Emticicia sp. BO119]MBA4851779.1 T9SS type A sorting domain-containing protein [Emticicia sp. BO119]